MTKTNSQKNRAKQVKKARQAPDQVGRNTSRRRKSQGPRVQVTGSSMSMMTAPVRSSNVTSTYFRVLGEVNYQGKKCLKIQAKDYLAVATFATTALIGTNVLNIPICPTIGAFQGTRIARFCSMYEKYLFTKLSFHCDMGAGTQRDGAYLMAYDHDPSDPTPSNGDDGLRTYYAMEGAQGFPIWSSGAINADLGDLQEFYYSDPGAVGFSDERLYTQGQFYASIGAAQVQTTNAQGSIYCEFEILLFEPELGALVSQSQQTAAAHTPSNTPGQAWSVAAFPIANVQRIGQDIQNVLDNTGTYRGFRLSPGQYYIEQIINNSTGAQNILAPLLNALLASQQGNAFVANEFVYNAIAGGVGFRRDHINVPLGGAELYGSVQNTSALVNFIVNILNAGQPLIA